MKPAHTIPGIHLTFGNAQAMHSQAITEFVQPQAYSVVLPHEMTKKLMSGKPIRRPKRVKLSTRIKPKAE